MSATQYLMPAPLQGKSSIYRAMSLLAQTNHAVDLAQGFSQLSPPGSKALIEHAANAMLTASQSYTDPRGLASLRCALAADTQTRFGVSLDPDQNITVTAGAQDALGAAMLGLLSAGDEVVFIEPFYNPMIPLARLTGATLRFASLLHQGEDGAEFYLDENDLLASMSERTKLIVYNSPNNPSGHVFSRSELQILARACHQFDAYLIADEVYEHLVYEGQEHISALQIPDLAERAVVISSISKSYLFTGWRVGWAQGAAPLVTAIAKIHSLMSFCLPESISEGARYALQEAPDNFLDTLRALHQDKRDRLCRGLKEAGLKVCSPQGTFFCHIDIAAISSKDDLDFCLAMPSEIGVAGVPMSLSWNRRRAGTSLIRLCFSRPDDALDRAVRGFTQWMETNT